MFTRQVQWCLLDNFRRQLFVRHEVKRVLLRSFVRGRSLKNSHRYYALFVHSTLPRTSAVVKQRNRCVVTGRYWSTLRKPQQSRFVFRKNAHNGVLPGVRRSSW